MCLEEELGLPTLLCSATEGKGLSLEANMSPQFKGQITAERIEAFVPVPHLNGALAG